MIWPPMLLRGRVLSALTSLRAAYHPHISTVGLREAQSAEQAASSLLQGSLVALRAPFSAQPAYASDEESEPETALESRPITPDTRHAASASQPPAAALSTVSSVSCLLLLTLE